MKKKMMMLLSFIFICLISVLSGAIVLAGSARAASIDWVPGSGDFPPMVGDFTVIEYKDASVGGGNWSVSGSGSRGGTGSPYKAMQVWNYRHVLLCKHLIFRYVLPEAMTCNLLKLLTRIVL